MTKETAKDVFFEIEGQQVKTPFRFHVLAGVICVIFAGYVWMLNPIPYIHGDQINIVTMILSKEHPENFARDTAFGGKAADFYPPLARGIIKIFINNFGVIGGHRVLQFPLSVIYLFVMYGVLYYLTRSVPASLLVTLASLMWRWTMAETYWGISRMQAVQPRSFAIIFIPILFILFWKWRDDWKLLIPAFVTGLLFNINPPTAMAFALLIWASLLIINFRSRDRIIKLFVAGFALILGAAPFLYTTAAIRHRITAALTPQEMQAHLANINYVFNYLSYKIRPEMLGKALYLGFTPLLFLAAIAWCKRKEKRSLFDGWMVWFTVLAFAGTVILQFSIQGICEYLKIEPFTPNIIRGQTFVYLVLYIYIAWLLAELFRRFAFKEKAVLITVCAIVIAVMPVFGNGKEQSQSSSPFAQWDYNTQEKDALFRGEKIEMAGWFMYMDKLCQWAKQKTPANSLFLFADKFMDPFRIYAQRSMVISQISGGVAHFNGPRVLAKWVDYEQQIDEIMGTKSASLLLKLANDSKADYIVTANDFPEVTGWTTVYRDPYWRVYKRS